VSLGYLEARRETTGAPGKESGVASAFAAKTIFLPVQSFGWDVNPSMLFRDDELRGTNEPLYFTPETFDPTWTITMRMYPDALAFFLNTQIAAVTTAGDGIITDLGLTVIPAGAYRHRFAAPYSSGSLPRTLMFRSAYTEEGVYWDVRGAAVESIEWASQDTGGCIMTISGKATFVARTADPALTPVYESFAIPPFQKSRATLTWLGSSAPTEDITVRLENPTDYSHTFGAASRWTDLVEYGDTSIPTVTGTIQKRRTTAADYDAMIAATRFTALIGFVNEAFATGAYPYKFYIQGTSSAAYTGGKVDAQTNARRTGGNFDFKFTRDASVSSTLEVVNATATYV
jgi:hypothetical protein